MQQDGGWSRGEISGAYAAGYVVWGGFAMFAGRLADRHGARILMTVGGLLGGACLLALAGSHQLWQLYLFWGVGIGITMGLTSNEVPFTTLANWFVRRRGAAIAIFTGLTGLSLPLFVPAASWIVVHHGWRTAVVAVGLTFILLLAPACAIMLRRRPEDFGLAPDGDPAPVATDVPAVTGIRFREAIAGRTFWALTFASSLCNLALTAVVVHQIAFLIDRGYAPVFAAGVAGLMGLVSLPGRVIFALAIDRMGALLPLALALGAEGVGIALLLLAPSAGWLLLFVLVFGLGFGSIGSLRAAGIAEQFGRLAFGSIATAAALPTYLAAALGAVASGWLFDRLGSYQLSFWAAAGACGVSALVVLATRWRSTAV
jgi:MFS family permease